MEKLQPTLGTQRIQSLDVLRGFAILGILIMNIQSFSMPAAAYMNPSAYGDLTGINKIAFLLSDLFADQKFMSIFSILFGAGIILITDRAKKKQRSAARIHYSRNFWLLIIGLCHAYLIWYGDILVTYALIGFLIFFLRNKSPKTLLILAGTVLLVPTLINMLFGFSLPYWPQEDLNQTAQIWLPDAEVIQKEIMAYQSSWTKQLETRINAALGLQTFVFFINFLWRAGGMMLIGMAFYKLGILSAQKSEAFYKRMVYWGFGLGLPITALGLLINSQNNWSFEFSMFQGAEFNYWGSIALAFAYIGIIMLICKSEGFKQFKYLMSNVGRMALTNYLMQSIICTFIFYGHGLALFGSVERATGLLIVLGVWILQIMYSPWWLNRFQFGPFEWFWRSLTYWKLQPFRKK